MKRFYLTSILVLEALISPLAQNTFPSTGNVGITTSSPSTILCLGTNINNKLLAVYDGTADFYGFGIQGYQMRLQVGNPNARFSFFGGDTNEVMTVKGNGSVGIGSTSPTDQLEIANGNRRIHF